MKKDKILTTKIMPRSIVNRKTGQLIKLEKQKNKL